MKRKRLLLSLLFAFCMLFTLNLTACGTSNNDKNKTYSITFLDYDGTIISTKSDYYFGDIVVEPPVPIREDDADYMYTFSGWDSKVTIVTGNKIYRATYTKSDKNYDLEFEPSTDKTYCYLAGAGTFTGTSLVIPSSYNGKPVKRIRESAFKNCYNLINITIPESVISFGIFVDEVLINSGTVSSITSEDSGVFDGCINLENVYYDGTIEQWCKIDFSVVESNPMKYAKHFYIKENGGYKEVTEVMINESLTEIKNYTFYGFNNLSKVTIANSVKKIGNSAFSNCTNLNSINIPNNVKEIRGYAFSNCRGLKEVIFENTSGWEVHNNEIDYYPPRPLALISSVELSNKSTAAEYLTFTYVNDRWKHE